MSHRIKNDIRAIGNVTKAILIALSLIYFTQNISAQNNTADDPDKDGFYTAWEQALGTDPADPRSRPSLADNHEKILFYWPLTNSAAEAFGSGLDGTLKDNASFSEGSLYLDGKNDYVNFGNDPALSVTSNLSCAIWLKTHSHSAEKQRIIGKFTTREQQREFSALFQGKKLLVFYSDDGTCEDTHSIRKMSTSKVLDNTQWQHLTAAWDSRLGKDGVYCYINGAALPMADLCSTNISTIHSGNADLTLGAYDIKHSAKPARPGKQYSGAGGKEIVITPFEGHMAQLLLCGGTLTGLEAKELTLLGRESDLLSYINMDYDNDGIVDWFERRYFGDISQSPEDDFDEDGLTNQEEFELGTNPTVFDTDSDGAGDGFEVLSGTDPLDPASFPAGISGALYYDGRQIGPVTVIASTNENSWQSIYTDQIPFARFLKDNCEYSIQGIPNQRNCRLKAYRDSNNNGLQDFWEAQGEYFNNPFYLLNDISEMDIILSDPDIDDDGMADWWELFFLGSLSAEPSEDRDSDGKSNLSEFQENTDPTNPDTDRDGFNDDYDQQLSRAYIDWGNLDYTQGDDYTYAIPDWLLRAHKTGGEWTQGHPEAPVLKVVDNTFDEQVFTNKTEALMARAALESSDNETLIISKNVTAEAETGSEWYVSASEPDNYGSLMIKIDRSQLNRDVVMEINLWDYAGSSLYVDLLDEDHNLLASDLYGNYEE